MKLKKIAKKKYNYLKNYIDVTAEIPTKIIQLDDVTIQKLSENYANNRISEIDELSEQQINLSDIDEDREEIDFNKAMEKREYLDMIDDLNNSLEYQQLVSLLDELEDFD